MKQFFNKISRKTRWGLIIAAVVGSSILSYSFSDNYFEISKNLDVFSTLFKELNIYYVDETKPGDLMKSAIDNMLQTLDPYTNYIPESDIEDYRFMTTGQYGGIGALIRTKDDHVVVAEPYEGFPAHKSGLLAGDMILEINGKSTSGKSTSDISMILKGEPNTTVNLLITRDGKKMEKELIREEIKINDVPYFGMLSEEIGYIKLNSFTESASREVISAFKELRDEQGMKSLILDLRGNGGGLLREAVNIVNMFVEKGQEVVETKGKVKDWDRSHKALNSPVDLEMPVAVLIDGSSASASEIVSGAIQDLDRGVVIGRKSFGKGLVQQTRSLSYNAKLKVTVAKYYIPSGRCIQKIDYSHKDQHGRAGFVPDSLITKFKTKGGRTVYDGAGILPDINVKEDRIGNITVSLVSKMLIFDYATQFSRQHDSISKPADFQLSDEEYIRFTEFLKGKDYDYVTKSEKMLEEFENVAMKEKYYENVRDEYVALKQKVQHDKNADLLTFKEEIKMILENEIVSRYYYQRGRVEASLSSDKNVKEAIEVLSEKERYESILHPSYKPDINALQTEEDDNDDLMEEFYEE